MFSLVFLFKGIHSNKWKTGVHFYIVKHLSVYGVPQKLERLRASRFGLVILSVPKVFNDLLNRCDLSLECTHVVVQVNSGLGRIIQGDGSWVAWGHGILGLKLYKCIYKGNFQL